MVKRIFDVLVSVLVLIILSPLILILIAMVKYKMGGPVFFVQIRPGMDSKPFKMIKFRTMTNDIDEEGNLLNDRLRLTKLGSIMRKTSLDELPELMNVIKGDMSLVGPRPLLMSYLEVYTDEEKKRHNVRPGITGLSQVNGRNNLNWDERLKLDIEYVNTKSLILDIKILFKTILLVLKNKDVNTIPGEHLKPLDEIRNGK